MRGKYKQIFLRVSAAGEAECAPASLRVSPDRTMDVYVEVRAVFIISFVADSVTHAFSFPRP